MVTQETIIFFTSTYLKPVLQSAYLQHSVTVTKIDCGCSVCYYVITLVSHHGHSGALVDFPPKLLTLIFGTSRDGTLSPELI